MLFLILFFAILSQISSQILTPSVDIKALSELPLEKLLSVKKSFNNEQCETFQKSDDIPEAMALQSKQKPKKRGYHYVYHKPHEEYEKKDKKSVQKIFQLSVTTLAFLAFGGYLLCLLVQAIKGKDNNMYASTTEVMSALLNSRPQVIRRRRKPTRRPHFNHGYHKKRRPKRSSNFLNAESLYDALTDLSEGYAKYNSVGYIFNNQTLNDLNL